MTSITVKNIPDDIYQRLKTAAKTHRRSINSELINCLETVLKPNRIRTEERLERLRAIRPAISSQAVSSEDISKAINDGRP